jgi:hypothetical protein
MIKAFLFACLALLLLTGAKCSISSTFDDDDDKDDGLTIVVSNAETTSSEVVVSLTQTLMVAEIASQFAEHVEGTNTPSSYSCDNSNSNISVTTNDLDNSTTISIGDVLFLNYSNCNVDNVIVDGNLTILLLDITGIDVGKYDSGTSWLYSVNAKTNFLHVSRGNEAFTVDGEVTITVEFDATIAELESNITSNTLTLDNGSTNILSAIDISQIINLAVVPSSYTLAIESLKISSGAQNGTVVATTTLDGLSGMEILSLSEHFVDLHFPENGMVNISGKNSNANLSIMPDQLVAIDIDTNGDSISDTFVSSSWSQLQKQ